GLAGGQLQPGWRLEGHLGAGVAHLGSRPRAGRRRSGPQATQGAERREGRQERGFVGAATTAVAIVGSRPGTATATATAGGDESCSPATLNRCIGSVATSSAPMTPPAFSTSRS